MQSNGFPVSRLLTTVNKFAINTKTLLEPEQRLKIMSEQYMRYKWKNKSRHLHSFFLDELPKH